MTGRQEYNTARSVHTARKPRRCDGDMPKCYRTIEQGRRYTRLVAFPGHDANGGTTPWVLKLCGECYPIPEGGQP
jgi:hypothetical protein